jgi:drug/metabolite transporter (DMT)-like permease
MASAALFFSVSYGLVRHLSESINAFEQTLFRQSMGMLIMLPFVLRAGSAGFKTHQLKTNLIRNFAGYFGISLSFFSVTLIPISEAVALQNTLPLFTIVFAYILLRERPSVHRWLALAIGTVGALIILRPGFIDLSLGMIVALCAAASFGVSDTLCRKLSQTDDINSIVFYSFAIQIPLAMPLALVNWVTPSITEWSWLVALGLVSFVAQYSLSKAFILAEASVVSPVLFLRLPMAAVIGYVFFGQTTDFWTWVGAFVIFAATYYVTRREAKL